MRFSSLRSIGIGCAILGLAGTALVATAPKAHAQFTYGPFSSSTTVPVQTTEIVSGSTSPNSFLTFKKFDSSLGFLTGIQFNLTTTINTQLTVTNNAATPSSGNVSTSVDVTLIDPNMLFPLTPYFPQPPSPAAQIPDQGTDGVNLFTTTTRNFGYSLQPGATVMSGTISKITTTSGDINMGTVGNASSIFQEFTGAANDTIAITGRTRTQTNLGNTGGNTTASQMTTAGYSGTITYFYTDTPEPGTISLLGMGVLMGGAGFGRQIRRRRRIQA